MWKQKFLTDYIGCYRTKAIQMLKIQVDVNSHMIRVNVSYIGQYLRIWRNSKPVVLDYHVGLTILERHESSRFTSLHRMGEIASGNVLDIQADRSLKLDFPMILMIIMIMLMTVMPMTTTTKTTVTVKDDGNENNNGDNNNDNDDNDNEDDDSNSDNDHGNTNDNWVSSLLCLMSSYGKFTTCQ